MRLNLMAVAAIGLGSGLFGVVQLAIARPSNGVCELPRDLQSVIESKYPGRTVVSLSDLGDDDRGFFQKAHGDTCPGLVKVDFYGDGEPTLALALTTKSLAKGKTELVVAHQVGAIWKTITSELLTWLVGKVSAFCFRMRGRDRITHAKLSTREQRVCLVEHVAKSFENS